jgi:exosome complex component RRP4
MAITIVAPAPPANIYNEDSSSDEDDGGVDIEGDIDMRPTKRARHHGSSSIVTPGEIVTDDPQWMRYAFTSH